MSNAVDRAALAAKTSHIKDMTGLRFGLLVISRRAPSPTKSQEAHWLSQCDCGGTAVVNGSALRNGEVKNCGCVSTSAIRHTSTAEGALVEEWRPVLGYEGIYSVSNTGRVRSETRPRFYRGILTARTRPGRETSIRMTSRGYLVAALCVDGKRTEIPVHILMLEAFVGPRPKGMLGCHRDDIKTNNTLSNLRWDTHAGNLADAIANQRIRRGETSGTARLTEKQVREIRADARKQAEIAKDYGVHQSYVSHIKSRRLWAHLEG
jgi:hypothetical protein